MQAWRFLLFVFGAAAFQASLPRAFAILGATADECKKAYGKSFGGTTQEVSPPARIKYQFRWQDISVVGQFVGRDVSDSRCCHVTYMRYPEANAPRKPLTEDEIAAVLALNAGGSTWEKIGNGWRRGDRRAFAYEARGVTNGMADNAVIVFTADFYAKDANVSPEVKALMNGYSAK